MNDIAMINADLVVSEFGDIALTATENDDIIQTANNNISTRYGENLLHDNIGNTIYNKRVKLSPNGLAQIMDDCKNAILNGDERVADVKDIKATKDEIFGNCGIEYTLLTEDGELVDGRVSINIY